MTRSTKRGVAAMCGAMLIALLPAYESEGGLFGRRGCGSHGGWRGGGSYGSHGSYGGRRNGCGSHGGYNNGHGSHGGYGSNGGYVSNGCGSHGGYSNGHRVESVPHDAQYRGGYTEERTYTDGVQDQGLEGDVRYRDDSVRQGEFDRQRTTGELRDRTTAPELNGQNRTDQQTAPPPPTDQAPTAPPQPGEPATDAASDATNGQPAEESTPQQ